MHNKFYITCSLPYTNAPAHIGHLLEFVQADTLARYNRLLGKDVFFLTGTDEHGRKNVQAAESKGKSPQEFVDEISAGFKELIKIADISIDGFVRTSDESKHWPAVHKLWNKLKGNEDLYKAKYEGLYCVGHEAFIKKSELKNGLCPDHKIEPEKITEENYFFRLSKYKNKVEKLIREDKIKILPATRKSEMLQLIKDSEDVSASRPRESINWGVPVPDDSEHIIYIWLEALTSYLSGVGYSEETSLFKRLWPPDVQVVGKDINRFHSIVWPAMLLAAGLATPKSIYVHGFITVGGQKMSKSLGNVVDPFELVKKYGTDAVRYFLLREIPATEDGDFTYEKFEKRYDSDLAGGLGNLVARVVTLAKKSKIQNQKSKINPKLKIQTAKTWKKYHKALEEFKFNEALGAVWGLIGFCDRYIERERPWEKLKKQLSIINDLLFSLGKIAEMLKPFLPETSEKIQNQLKIKKPKPLFPRL